MNIYWVESLDHCEDWFIAALDNQQACDLFAETNGYEITEDQVFATHICPLPDNVTFIKPDYLDNDSIIACGGEFIEFHDEDLLAHVPKEFIELVSGETRIVRLGKKVYMEGNVVRVALLSEGKISFS